jgi:STE24 endopeptidase
MRFKYISVTDKLLENATPDEITATIAHELGHWYHLHNIKGMIPKQPKAFVLLAFWWLMEDQRLFREFGFDFGKTTTNPRGKGFGDAGLGEGVGRDGVGLPPVLGFLLFQMVGIAVQPLWSLGVNALSQYQEYQAGKSFPTSNKIIFPAPLLRSLIRSS